MSSSDAFNFGRKIKDLKRNYNKTYADLTAGLKISRERIMQLEENEREPTEVERRRFADFYALPPEELGLFGGGASEDGLPQPPVAPPGYNQSAPRDYGNTRPSPPYNQPPGNFQERPPYNNFNQGERPAYNNRPTENGGGFRNQGGYQDRGQGNFQERPPNNYQDRGQGNFQERPPNNYQDRGQGNFQERPPNNYQDRGQGNFQDRGPRPPSGGSSYQDRGPRPPGGGSYQDRGPRPAGGNYQDRGQGNFQDRGPRPPATNRPQSQGDDAERPARPPRPAAKPREVAANTGEPKPVMKYTAEQLGDIESAYLRKQRDLKVPLKFTFMNGKEYTGVVVDFTPFTVHIIEQDTGEEVILRKLAMSYYRKADAVEEARQSQAEGASKSEEV